MGSNSIFFYIKFYVKVLIKKINDDILHYENEKTNESKK